MKVVNFCLVFDDCCLSRHASCAGIPRSGDYVTVPGFDDPIPIAMIEWKEINHVYMPEVFFHDTPKITAQDIEKMKAIGWEVS